MLQVQQNTSTLNTRGQKKSDGFINLKVEFTDASGTKHAIKAPMFGLDASDPLQAALINNPALMEHIDVSIDSIRAATPQRTEADINLDFASQEASLDL